MRWPWCRYREDEAVRAVPGALPPCAKGGDDGRVSVDTLQVSNGSYTDLIVRHTAQTAERTGQLRQSS